MLEYLSGCRPRRTTKPLPLWTVLATSWRRGARLGSGKVVLLTSSGLRSWCRAKREDVSN